MLSFMSRDFFFRSKYRMVGLCDQWWQCLYHMTWSGCRDNNGVQIGIWGDCDCNVSVACDGNCTGGSGSKTICRYFSPARPIISLSMDAQEMFVTFRYQLLAEDRNASTAWQYQWANDAL
ncbi:MAG: hypothetical protein U0T81_01100 [Saprospiraceae bacterium]